MLQVKDKGVSIFLMQAGMLGTVSALWDVFSLFTNARWSESANVAFLKKHMGATFEQRPKPWISNISVDDIHSGDFLALSKIRGRWGGFETLEKWVSGAFAGHTAVLLKDSEGRLWVCESGNENDQVNIFCSKCHIIKTISNAMPNLALKNVKLLYLTFDAPMHKCYFKCNFVILLFFSCKNQ